MTRRAGLVTAGLAVLLLATVLVATAIGPYAIAPLDIVTTLVRRAMGLPATPPFDTVILQIRLPRVAAAALVGAALAGAGAAYQTLFRNPLVSPDILGVSTGAGLGAVFGILLGLPVMTIQLFGFVTGIATVGLVVFMARMLQSQNDIFVLVLSGIVVGSLASAAISLIKILADPYQQLPAITFWLLGSIAGIKQADVIAIVPLIVLGIAMLVAFRWHIGVLSLGDDEARTLGVNATRIRLIVIVAATLVTASVVAVSGVIGWVGLMVPHMARMIAGDRFDRMLPATLLLGASFMIVVDTLARSIASIEVPLGVLTALVGAPTFVWLLARSRGLRGMR